MSRKSFNPRECIAPLNNVKRAMLIRKSFSKEMMLQGLKGSGLPVNSIFWNVFLNSNIIARISKTEYRFVNEEPIYIRHLENIKCKYSEIRKKYLKEAPAETNVSDPIQEAINLLKENGYKILKLTTEYIEVQCKLRYYILKKQFDSAITHNKTAYSKLILNKYFL